MLFNSTYYIVFLLIVIPLYYSLSPYRRRLLLLLASYTFYWFWSIPFSGLLFMSTVLDYFASRIIASSDKRQIRYLGLFLSLIGNLGVLALFKYADFFSNSAYSIFGFRPWPELNLVLPLGISFYTFQTMSYTIDVFRKNTFACKSIIDVALYVSYFPQLVAGPIVRAHDLIDQLSCRTIFDWGNIRKGCLRIIWGLGKKVFVADVMAGYVHEAYNNPEVYSGFALVIATYAFAIQIYCDFSGYSDIAIGSSQLLGITLPENFRSPYLSGSVSEFWKRWHISLSTWLQDYLYIPLGGNRKGRLRTYINLMITMLLGGLWHGAGWNWVVWGGIQGIMMSIERMVGIQRTNSTSWFSRILRWFFTFQFTCVSWVFFRARNLSEAWIILGRIITQAPGQVPINIRPLLYLVILLTVEILRLREHIMSFFVSRPMIVKWVTYIAIVVFLLAYRKASNPEFIYFQF